MSRKERMMTILTQAFSPCHLEIIDESHKHAGHMGAAPGGETHYQLIIASSKLEGLSKVKAHQAIYGLLADEFKSGLHALAIKIIKDQPDKVKA